MSGPLMSILNNSTAMSEFAAARVIEHARAPHIYIQTQLFDIGSRMPACQVSAVSLRARHRRLGATQPCMDPLKMTHSSSSEANLWSLQPLAGATE